MAKRLPLRAQLLPSERSCEEVNAMRDARADPHPGDKFQCLNGNQFEVAGVVISVAKNGRETRFLYVNRLMKEETRLIVVSFASLHDQVLKAEVIERGSESDPWVYAEHQTAGELSSRYRRW